MCIFFEGEEEERKKMVTITTTTISVKVNNKMSLVNNYLHLHSVCILPHFMDNKKRCNV